MQPAWVSAVCHRKEELFAFGLMDTGCMVCVLVSEGLQRLEVICERLKPPSEKCKKVAWSPLKVVMTKSSFSGIQEKRFCLSLGWLNASWWHECDNCRLFSALPHNLKPHLWLFQIYCGLESLSSQSAAVRITQAMVISALREDPVGQWWPTGPSKWRILVMGMSNSSNFSNSKRHVVAFKRITQAKLSHLTGNKLKSSFKRNWAYLSCRKLSCLHNKPLGTEARHRPAADHMMPSVTWTSFAEKISLMSLLDSYSAD